MWVMDNFRGWVDVGKRTTKKHTHTRTHRETTRNTVASSFLSPYVSNWHKHAAPRSTQSVGSRSVGKSTATT